MGLLFHWEKADEGYILTNMNCPYRQVTHDHAEVCAMDMALLTRLFGVEPKPLSRMRSGDASCTLPARSSRNDARPLFGALVRPDDTDAGVWLLLGGQTPASFLCWVAATSVRSAVGTRGPEFYLGDLVRATALALLGDGDVPDDVGQELAVLGRCPATHLTAASQLHHSSLERTGWDIAQWHLELAAVLGQRHPSFPGV